MIGRIDVHSHLLPDVDDGCRTIEESIECARRIVARGYTHIFCTPHLIPTMPNHMSSVVMNVAALQQALTRAGVNVTLIPGGEINIQAMWPALREMNPAEIPTFNNARRYALIDFWADTLPPGFADAVQYLQSLGLTVIMAHPERIAAFQNDPHVWKEVADLGCRFQGNFQCFSDPPGSAPRELVEKHARDGTYWLMGTDTHWPETLDVRLDGLTTAISVLGEALVDRLTRENPRELMA